MADVGGATGVRRSQTTTANSRASAAIRSRALDRINWRARAQAQPVADDEPEATSPGEASADMPLYSLADAGLSRHASMPTQRDARASSSRTQYRPTESPVASPVEAPDAYRSMRSDWRDPSSAIPVDAEAPLSPISGSSDAGSGAGGGGAGVRRHHSLNTHQRASSAQSTSRLPPIGSPGPRGSYTKHTRGQSDISVVSSAGEGRVAARSRAGTVDGTPLSIKTQIGMGLAPGSGPWSPTVAEAYQLGGSSAPARTPYREEREASITSLPDNVSNAIAALDLSSDGDAMSPTEPAITPKLRASAVMGAGLSAAQPPPRKLTPSLPPLNTAVAAKSGPVSAAAYVPPIGHAHSTAQRDPFASPSVHNVRQGQGRALTAAPGIGSEIWARQKEGVAGFGRGSPAGTPQGEYPQPYQFGNGPFSPGSAGAYGQQQQQGYFPGSPSSSRHQQQPPPPWQSQAQFQPPLPPQQLPPGLQQLIASGQLPPNWMEILQASMQATGQQFPQTGFPMPPPPMGMPPPHMPQPFDGYVPPPPMMPHNGHVPSPGFGPPPSSAHSAPSGHHQPPLVIPPDVAAFAAERGLNPPAHQVDLAPRDAHFAVIKSLTEDDVHKSIKHSIWASTPLGNKRLDRTWREANKPGAPPSRVLLFFSVNASGHFCGVAEMLSGVDETVDSSVWAAQGKWRGLIKLRWLFVRDVPNGALRHLKLHNTPENKPVTSSRDTQDVPYDIGCEMLRIFATFNSRTSLLQDFVYYDQQRPGPDDGQIVVPATSPPPDDRRRRPVR